MENIITIHVTDLEGQTHEIQAPTDMGMNVMEAIRANELPIKATCGGMAMCATCNCVVKSDHSLPEMSEDEEAMLDEAFVLDIDGSRLMCQIPLTDEIDGLRIVMGELTGE
ncbi:2Fe-2S iron-sulfur cluster-binding protein [Bacteroidia bacterium]|nr:2Fe-2S iron-sulfur cluster binding domain-containing protein [Bacteroidota bacterium]MDA9111013.1 2Fe-2S iron-sulfur cluster-binding protein [Bacteroidia bacterium]MDB4173545.1 2Fe-2S iron-sulfur cluster-binding protein [Bacteroidia bacterium]